MGKVFPAIALALLSVIPTISVGAGVDVLVGRYDQRGTGANLRETVLNTSNVNPSSFGKLFSYEVEGFIYAQPLIVSGVLVRGRPRNLVYVATTNNMVYALDADDPGPEGGLLWQTRLTEKGAFPMPSTDDLRVQGNRGILSTPVIDRARGAIYIVARSLWSNRHSLQRLHALDLLTGAEKAGSPKDIEPLSVTVRKDGEDGITFTFNPEIQSNRAGLTVAGSKIIIAWSGLDNYQGWVMAYDADTLQRTGFFCTTCGWAAEPKTDLNKCQPQEPEGGLIGGGIWQSGRPPVVDSKGHVYYFTGNGWTHGCRGKGEIGWYLVGCTPGTPGTPDNTSRPDTAPSRW